MEGDIFTLMRQIAHGLRAQYDGGECSRTHS
jgi:hypothetical protein